MKSEQNKNNNNLNEYDNRFAILTNKRELKLKAYETNSLSYLKQITTNFLMSGNFYYKFFD